MACIDSCPTSSIVRTIETDGHPYVTINHDTCIGCHKCERVCPAINNFKYSKNTFELSTPYAAYATDAKCREKASSGGVFAAMAQYIISIGGIVYGAELKENKLQHIAINCIEDIKRLQGSKYMISDTTGIYKKVKQDLDNNKYVLFSGVGCQVGALLSFLGKHPHINNLYTIDLVCGGVPSTLLVERFLKESSLQPSQIIGFRSGKDYIFSYSRNGEIIKAGKSDRALPLYGYTSGLTNRHSCNNCQFAGTHRQSAITIGDFWHDTFTQHHRSVIICHNANGKELIQKAAIKLDKIEWNDFLPYNPRIAYGKTLYSNRIERKYLSRLLGKSSYNIVEKIYATKIATCNIPWMIYKIERYLFQRLNTFISKLYIKKLLNKR